MNENKTDGSQESHQQNMEKLKESVDARVKEAKTDKGVIIVLTGDGKGKSSSGFGMVLRCLGYKMPVGVVQFVKGKWKTGEQLFLSEHPEVEFFQIGQGFTWNTQDKKGDIERAHKCWEKAEALLSNQDVKLVLLDELNVVLSFEYLPIEVVIEALQKKPEFQHVVITGRNAPQEIIDIADTVSRVEVVKHAFDNGIRAQKGIEF